MILNLILVVTIVFYYSIRYNSCLLNLSLFSLSNIKSQARDREDCNREDRDAAALRDGKYYLCSTNHI